MKTRERTKHILKKVYLDTVASAALQGWRQFLWDASRGFGRLDQRIARGYLSSNPVRKLHIGCGPRVLDGWLNVDAFPSSPRVMHLDATKPFPLPDKSIDFVFSEHMIEHVSHSDGEAMLRECHRVMRMGATIRISTPDLAFLVNLYGHEKSPLQEEYVRWSIDHYLPNAKTVEDSLVLNNFVREWGHKFIYDEKTLRQSMEGAGFANITRCRLQESEVDSLRNLENETRMPPGFLKLETFTLEGTK